LSSKTSSAGHDTNPEEKREEYRGHGPVTSSESNKIKMGAKRRGNKCREKRNVVCGQRYIKGYST